MAYRLERTAPRRLFVRAIAAACAGFALLSGAANAQSRELRAADTHPAGYPTVEAVNHLGKLLAERTQGRLSVKMFAASALGQEKDTIEQTKLGAIDLNRVNLAPFNGIVPESTVPPLPFLFRNKDHMRRVLDGPIGDDILKAFEPHGFVGLAFYDSGARSFYNSRKVIKSPADIKGMKIRVQQSDLFVSLIQALGGNPTPMPFGEVYTALKTNLIDGAENNFPSYESTRHFEAAKFYTESEHSMSPEVLVISKRTWDALAPADREVLRKAAKDSVPFMRKLWDEREKTAEANVVKAGATVTVLTEAEKKAFQDAVKPVYDKLVTDARLKDLVRRIQEAK